MELVCPGRSFSKIQQQKCDWAQQPARHDLYHQACMSLWIRKWSKVLRSLRRYPWTQGRGHHHTIDHLEENGVERGNACRSRPSGEKWPSSIRPTLDWIISKATFGKPTSERGGGALMGLQGRIVVPWLGCSKKKKYIITIIQRKGTSLLSHSRKVRNDPKAAEKCIIIIQQKGMS